MTTAWTSPDDQLVASLLAPPDLDDGIEALRFWRERRRGLAWYRLRARREAALMTVRWEQRVAAAMLAQHSAPVALRMHAGLLVAHTKLRRWGRRAAVAVAATFALGLVLAAVAVASAVSLLLHML